MKNIRYVSEIRPGFRSMVSQNLKRLVMVEVKEHKAQLRWPVVVEKKRVAEGLS